MKRKIFAIFGMVVCLGLCLTGCGKTTLSFVNENLSESTQVYFMGENESFYSTISSGQREENYIMNGISGQTTAFALLTIIPVENVGGSIIKANLTVDGQTQEYELEINGINQNFMVDFERELTGDEVIEVTYNGQTLTLENVSKNFVVDSNQALSIACNELEDEILSKKAYSNLNAECYLRILDKKSNNFDGIFWCFTVLNIDNESFSVIISTQDGSILAKSN